MPVKKLGNLWGFAALVLVACGSDGGPAGPGMSPEDAAGAAGAPSGPDQNEGGSASAGDGGAPPEPGCPTTFEAAGGAGGAPEPGPGCLTTDVPAGTFLIDPLDTEDPGQQFTQLGPWLMTFRTTAPGKLEAAVVSSHSALWAVNGFEAAGFELEADDHGVYRLPRSSHAALATYAYDSVRVPGLCLHNGEVLVQHEGSNHEPSSELRFYDTSGDGVADALTLRGTLVTLGLRGGDYEADCGNEGAPLHTAGELVDWPVDVRPDGDAMHPRLLLDGGFLNEATAAVVVRSGLEAAPLSVAGFIYGFAAAKTLEPGSPLIWRVEGVDNLERPFSSFDQDLSFGTVEPWLLVSDGGFESFDDGRAWGDGRATARASCPDCSEVDAALPPISGTRSLHIFDFSSGGSRFRFARSAGQTRLSFLAFGDAEVEAAIVGDEPTTAFEIAAADCSEHAAFCAAAPAGSLMRYTIELAPGVEDVLLSIQDHSAVFGVTAGGGVWIDDLALE